MAAEDKCIGRLYLDIKQVKQDIDEVNKFLGKIGANVNLEKKLSEGIKNALDKMVREAKKAGEEASKAVSNIGSGSNTKLEGLQSQMRKITSEVDTFVREADQSGKTIEKLVSTVTSGFDKYGNKIKEFANAEGDIVKRTEELGTGTDAVVKMYVRLYDQMAKLRTLQNSGNTNGTNYIKTANEVAQLSAQIDALDDKTKEYARDTEEVSRAISQFNQIARGSDQSHALRELINLYKELYSMSERAIKAGTRGDNESVERYQQVATAIRAQITELERGNEELGVRARRSEEVRNAELRWSETAETAQRRREANSAREIENIDRIIAREEERVRTEAQLAEREQERTRIEQERTRRADYEELWINLLKEQDQALTDLINKYKEYYGLESKKIQAVNNGDIDSADMYRARAQAIWEEISAIEAERPRLADLAGATEQVTKAVRDWQAVANAGQIKSDNIINKQEIENTEQALNNLIQKYQEYYALESQKINAVHRGDVESADIYRERAKALWEEIRAIEAANQKLAELASESDKVNKAVQQWQMTAKQGEINAEKMFGIQGIANAKQKYFELTDAIKNYQAASKLGNKDDMSMWQEKITAIMQEVNAIEQAVQASDLEAGVKQQILNIIQQCTTAEHQHNAAINESVRGTGELESQMTSLLTRLFGIMAVIRTIKSLIQNTVDYVSQYYDKMNEIQIITQKSDAEVKQLGDTYRNIAEMMNVSSLEMADAAIYFTRQGLAAAEIEKRLKNVTMYAKTANVEFQSASEIITSVVNSMGLVEQEAEDGRNATQRVADVFLAIGDNAATSGQEIGEAMQKAAASAGAFGVSMEWLAAYIATVSETTRQEARTIGTAFNTIIARLHQIKEKGYNSEDETRINDIAKALAKIDVVLMDQDNNWRDMEDILEDVAGQWDGLDGKTKSYIATTMAGVKQQNVFLALMNDMSKGIDDVNDGIENGSRAYELHEKAINSAGTAQKKYATWTDSVTAAQERLTVAQEKFYSLLDANVIKDWYNALAGFVTMINNGTEAFDGWNIAIPLITAGIVGLVAVVKNFATISSALLAHPVIAAIAGVSVAVVGLTTVISGLASEIGSAKQRFDEANKALSESQERLSQLTASQAQVENIFDGLAEGAELTSEDLKQYSAQLEQISSVSPLAKQIVDDLKAGFIDQKTAVEQLNEELERLIGNENKYSQLQMLKKYSNWSPEDTESDSMLYYMQTKWTDWASKYSQMDQWTDTQKFAYNLKQNWMDMDSLSAMPKAVREMIDETRKALKESNMTDEEKWGIIGQMVWQEFVGSDSYSLADVLKKRAEAIVDEAVNSLSAGLDATEIKALRKQMMDMLMGDDGEMDASEYKDIGNKMAKFMSDALANGIQLSDTSVAEAIGESLFGTATEGLFTEEGEAFAKAFIDQYNEAVKAGFSDADIAKLFKEAGVPTLELDQIGEIIVNQLRQSIANAMGQEDWLSLLDWNENWDSEEFGEIDLSTLKLVNDMMELGIEIEEIDELLANSNSPEEFAAGLNELANEAGITAEEAEEAAVSISDLVKSVKSYKSDISSLDKLYDKAVKNGTLGFDDIIGMADSHPELFSMVGKEVDVIKEKILEIRQTAIEGMADAIKQIMLNSEEEASKSEWAEQIKEAGVKTLKEYRDMLEATGGDFEEIDAAIEAAAQAILDAANKGEEAAVSITDIVKSIKSYRTEIKNLQTLYDKVVKNGKVDFEDVLGFTESHPELLALVDDTDALLQKIREIENSDISKMAEDVKSILLNSEDEAKKSPWAEKIVEAGAKTLKEYRDMLIAAGKDVSEIDRYVNDSAEAIKDAANKTKDAADTWLQAQAKIAQRNDEVNWAKSNNFVEQIGEMQRALNQGGQQALMNVWEKYSDEMKKAISDEYPRLIMLLAEVEEGMNSQTESVDEATKAYQEHIEELKQWQDTAFNGNVDLNNRPQVPGYNMQKAGWTEVPSTDTSTVYTSEYYAGSEGIKWNQNVVVSITPILENGEVLSPEALDAYMDQLFEESDNIDELLDNDREGKNLIINVEAQADDESFAQTKARVAEMSTNLHKAQDEIYLTGKNMDGATKSTKNLNKEFEIIGKQSLVKHFTKTNDAIKKLRNGTISAKEAYDTFATECDKVTKAQTEISNAYTKISEKTALVESDVNDLADVLGLPAQTILDDFPGAVEMFDQLISAGGELEDVFDALNAAAFIKITGVSEADFSELENGLFAIRSDAQEVIDLLIATGQWEIASYNLPQTALIWDPFSLTWQKQSAAGRATVLRPTGNNPFKSKAGKIKNSGSSSKRGGGGSSSKSNDSDSSSSSEVTEVQRMLDMMSQVQKIQSNQQSYYQAQRNYYSQTGQLQGVIAYAEKEKEVLLEQNKVLESNIASIEAYMKAKSDELHSMDQTDEKYEEVAEDLDNLQDQHAEYTKQIIENKTAIEQLNETIDNQRKKIRSMEIEIQNMIYQAIEDREAKIKSMLSAEIEMEDLILDIITKRYETERDEIISVQNLKIDALKEERDLLSEQLALRKKQADAEDKLLKLQQLETKYQHISADPTRRKEALKIQEQINSLRKEMAWDAAEDEVAAQQESIDQQITSLEDYIEYVENYYQDLFDHPQRLINEMRQIIEQSDEEIIKWLQENETSYAKSSENVQKQMVTTWNETLDSMHGRIKTYWDEVDSIIAAGDDAIIEFLKNNSAEYAKASKLQAEAFVEEWKKKLDDLKKAHEEVAAEIAASYEAIDTHEVASTETQTEEETDDDGSGGGGSGGSIDGGTGQTVLQKMGNQIAEATGKSASELLADLKTQQTKKTESSSGTFLSAIGDKISNAQSSNKTVIGGVGNLVAASAKTSSTSNEDEEEKKKKKTTTATKTTKKYASGGLATETGYAWIDGTKENPERVLNPYQTKLFETMVKTLEKVGTVNVPSMSNYSNIQTGSSSNVSVGDIVVNVDNLDTDADYEELAQKVSDVLMERIGKTAVVGGLHVYGW